MGREELIFPSKHHFPMPSDRDNAQSQEQLAAMLDASAGAFEAARLRYFRILNRLEAVSIAYVTGNGKRVEVIAVSEQLLEAEFMVSETARHTRLYQEALEQATSRSNAAPAQTDTGHLPPPAKRYYEMSIGV